MRSPIIIGLAVAAISASAQGPNPFASAQRWFQEGKWASEDDGGKLWGRPLYGRILFVNPENRAIVANQADKEGRLKLVDGIWTGTLPKEVILANTDMDWLGVH